jgi:hypothetical protein
VVTADAGFQRPPARGLASHIALGFVAVLLFVALFAYFLLTMGGACWPTDVRDLTNFLTVVTT